MDIETLDVDGVLFVSCWALSYGDYDNSTQLERGNVRYLMEQHDWCNCSTSNMHIRDARAGTFALLGSPRGLRHTARVAVHALRRVLGRGDALPGR